MDRKELQTRSELFVVRLWPEVLGDGRSEWRGWVEHVPHQESRYFREWGDLVTFLARVASRDTEPEGDKVPY